MRLGDVQGRSFQAVRFVPGERLSVVNYARALGIEDPVLISAARAREAGYAARPVPPAMFGFFLTVPAETLVTELGFTWGRTLNLGIDVVTAGRPVTEEDEVEGETSVEAVWERPGRDGNTRQFLRLRTDFRHAGALVCRWRVVFIENRPGVSDPALPAEPSGTADPDMTAACPGPAMVEPPADGALPSHVTGEVDRLMLARLSVALDNPDPLHLDDTVARDAGFDRVIGQGSAIVGLLHEPVRRWAGDHVPLRMRTRQRAPFTLGQILVADGVVAPQEDGGAGRRCLTQVRTAAGEQIGSAEVDVITSEATAS